MIVNPVFSKSGKEFNSILNYQTEKPNKNIATWSAAHETQTSSLF